MNVIQAKAKPYIGITGFKTKEEIKNIGEIVSELKLNISTQIIPMFGYLCSAHRLQNPDVPGRRSPAAKDLAALLDYAQKETDTRHINALHMIHYFTEDKENLFNEVRHLFKAHGIYANNHCRALQLNVDWPSIESVHRIKDKFPEMKIVLQLPERAIQDLKPGAIAREASRYDSLVDYVLIDTSGGRGKELDIAEKAELSCYLSIAMPTTRIAIAGGLSAGNAYNILVSLAERRARANAGLTEFVSIDAESRLRTEDNSRIDYGKAQAYISSVITAYFYLALKSMTT